MTRMGRRQQSEMQIVTAPDELEGDYVFKADFDILNKEILDNSNKIYQIIQIVFTSVPVFLAGVLALGKGDGEGSWWYRQHHFTPSVRHHHPFRTSRNLFAELDGPHLSIPMQRYFPSLGELKGWEYYIRFFRNKPPTNKNRFFGNSLTWIFAGLSFLTILVSLASFPWYFLQPLQPPYSCQQRVRAFLADFDLHRHSCIMWELVVLFDPKTKEILVGRSL